MLIVSNQLEQGSGLALVEQARALVEDIRTILIVDAQQDDLVAAGQSSADAVLAEADCFTEDKPVIALSRSLALGQRYRSRSVLAAMEAASLVRQCWRDEAPELGEREPGAVGGQSVEAGIRPTGGPLTRRPGRGGPSAVIRWDTSLMVRAAATSPGPRTV